MQTRLETDLGPTGLTRLGALVLSEIGASSGATPSVLAERVGVTRPAVSRLLRGLEAKGLITLDPGQGGDGRQKTVALTVHGRAVLTHVRAAFDQLQDHFSSKISDADMRHLIETLDALAANEPAPAAY